MNIDTSGRVGPLDMEAEIVISHPKATRITLQTKATVVSEFVVSERSLFMGIVSRGDKRSKEIFISAHPLRPVRLVSASSTNASFGIKLVSVFDSHGKTWKIIASIVPDAAVGYHHGEILVRTSSGLKPMIRIPIVVMIKDPNERKFV